MFSFSRFLMQERFDSVRLLKMRIKMSGFLVAFILFCPTFCSKISDRFKNVPAHTFTAAVLCVSISVKIKFTMTINLSHFNRGRKNMYNKHNYRIFLLLQINGQDPNSMDSITGFGPKYAYRFQKTLK